MSDDRPTCLLCTCEGTAHVDRDAIEAGGAGSLAPVSRQLCRAGLPDFEAALAEGGQLIVGCTQEAPLFEEVASEAGAPDPRFVNLRETAGWSDEAAKAGPKMAALLAGAASQAAPTRTREIRSDGLCLVYGSGQGALDAAQLLAPRLAVTLMLLDPADVVLPGRADVPIHRGRIRRLSGGIGGFDVLADGHAALAPSSRSALVFEPARDNVRSSCALVLDLSGGAPLVSGPDHRDGYERADPRDPAAVMRAAFALSDLVGTFEKPLYVEYDGTVCAHARSQITGCSKCLDACPAGAITENGDGVAIDPVICAGCGSCHAVCPTGAVRYGYPDPADLAARVHAMAQAFVAAGGSAPVLLVHDDAGGASIDALARFGPGLPARVVPMGMHAVTALGHGDLAGFLAAGMAQVVVLADPARRTELGTLLGEMRLAHAILAGLGAGAERVQVIETRDPDVLAAQLADLPRIDALAPSRPAPHAAAKREAARLAMAHLDLRDEGAAPIVLPEAAPYGRLAIDQEACTLCMACVSACPTGALLDGGDTPALRFTEAACVQCGLCAATCPETALGLVPQLDLSPASMRPETLYEEEPFACVECGTPFATGSTIARIKGALAGRHAMFETPEQARLIEMCDLCRVEVQANAEEGPLAGGSRPMVRTTDDDLRDREAGLLSAEDFLIPSKPRGRPH